MIDRVKAKSKTIASVFMILSLILIAAPADLGAQPSTHKVQRGDTLWSICEKYYGDSTLWPKLWEMNPFVTNPHLLKPGDLITLIEKEDMLKGRGAEKPSKEAAKPVPKMKGIDLGLLTNPATMGYLSLTKVEPWGEIYASTKSELGAEKGDKIFINFKNRAGVKPGDEFRVARPIPVRHPLTDYPMGDIISFRGAVVVKEYLKEDFFLAEVTDVWLEFGVGAMILPFEPLSKCVQPMATDPKLYGNIVALKDNRKIVGGGTVVFLDAGFKDGIQRGQVFDVVRITSIAAPAFRLGNFEAIVNEVGTTLSKHEYLVDFWKELNEGTKLYDYTVGKLMVVEARPASSTAIVLSSSEDLYTGAYLKGYSWSETPEFLRNLPSCPLE
ncbi:MAG: LysM peptidoglycan-binding domain-containing protein [Deltaproteobacteria bacterium]|nr:LysM peptidoglycan-binding domain-containing protein [Deltaproteobacteria bacterium]